MVNLVRDFHAMVGTPICHRPEEPALTRAIIRKNLIVEEFKELMTAMGFDVEVNITHAGRPADLVAVADGLCDLHYVLSGTSLEYGIPENACIDEVHRTNMAKANPDGTVTKLPGGKIVKPEGWQPPNLAAILETATKASRKKMATPCDCPAENTVCTFCSNIQPLFV